MDEPPYRADMKEAIIALRSIIETRLDAMDKASVILSDNVTRVPTLLDRSVATITNLTDEKFLGVQRQFVERDARLADNRNAAEQAIAAAMAAAREIANLQNMTNLAAAAKTEAATTKQIEAMGVLLANQSSSLSDKITEITARLDRDQGQHTGTSTTVSAIFTIAAIGIAIVSLGWNVINTRPEPAPIIVSPPPVTAK